MSFLTPEGVCLASTPAHDNRSLIWVRCQGANATKFARPGGVRGKARLRPRVGGLSDTGPLGIRRLEGDSSAGLAGAFAVLLKAARLGAVIQKAVGNPLRAGRI